MSGIVDAAEDEARRIRNERIVAVASFRLALAWERTGTASGYYRRDRLDHLIVTGR